MAVVQISRIQHRRGLSENLPQLSSAELGWSIDTQELYIGNGTIDEGAPEVGNTRILTALDLDNTYSQIITDGTTANLTYGGFTATTPGVLVQYQIVRQVSSTNTAVKVGSLRIAFSGNTLSFDDDATQTEDTLCNLTVTNYANTTAQISAVSTANGYNANVSYRYSTF